MQFPDFRLPYFYNLPVGILPLLIASPLSFTTWFGVSSWNLNRTINWGGMSMQTWLYLMLLVTLIPSLVLSGYYVYRFIKRKEVKIVKSAILLVITSLLVFFLPQFLI